ncbi:HesB/IscA family protein [Armatimonas rosea]|uniref:Iron-sulfur cluster assembly protein n=1 Tax=Armatimonas rosea TaxID=685828 RepID=A0A7W9W6Z4_ARMRO|nr:iron-sulfur cluster assembly accessory protein [Armatimonas rosea]MBB6051964.1 iron-sulfur cluster assembly protein [Armatimonas rosea]
METIPTTEPIVTLTPAAITAVKRQAKKAGKEEAFLRLGVRGGGCSGLSYVIDFEANPDPEFDLLYQQADLGVVVDIKSAKFLKDTTLDYNIKNLMEGGFVFDNPQAVRSCGCGTSFTAK